MSNRIGLFLVTFIFFAIVPLLNRVHAKCNDTRPAADPILVSTSSPSETSVTLAWQEAADPVSYYLLAYGTSETLMEFGIPNIGGRGTNTFTVNGLTKGVKYYFKVRAGNGCKPGGFSNKLSGVPGGEIESEYTAKPPKITFSESVLAATNSSELKVSPTPNEVDSDIWLALDTEFAEICVDCRAWQLLLGEFFALLLFFLVSYKLKSAKLKPAFSISIPIVTYLFYKMTSSSCPFDQFFCKYFLLLDLFIFVLIAVVFKQVNIKKHD